MRTTLTNARTVSIVLPRALPHQTTVITDPSRFKVVVCGRRWGKTAVGLMATVRGHGPERGARRGAIDGGKIWWVAPDYPTASELWRDLKRATMVACQHISESERRVELITGGSVTVKSAHDPDSLVAVGLDGLVMDEAARIDPHAWYQSLRPTLSDRGGWAIFISTPKGRNWFHGLFEFAGKTADWARWQRPTAENPLIPHGELEAARTDSPAYFRQEFEAQFTDVEGAEFPGEWFADHLWFDEWPSRRNFSAFALALDPSKGRDSKSGDYSAFVWGGLDASGTLWIDADLARRPSPQIVEAGVEHCRVLNPDGFGVETNQFQELLADDFARVAGATPLPLYKFNNFVNKKVRIRRCGPWLAQKRLRVKSNSAGARLLVDQLMAFGEDSKEHDDGPDALEMMIRLLTHLVQGRRQRQNDGFDLVRA